MDFQQQLNNKCEALLHLVKGIQEFYKSTNDTNKSFIETTVGAAIWYLPKKRDLLFTGKISKEAMKKGEKSEDHLYPRKITAQEILQFDWEDENNPVETLSNLYIEKYGRYNYVSKMENKRLIKYQKIGVFVDPETAYENAGIELVDLDVI